MHAFISQASRIARVKGLLSTHSPFEQQSVFQAAQHYGEGAETASLNGATERMSEVLLAAPVIVLFNQFCIQFHPLS